VNGCQPNNDLITFPPLGGLAGEAIGNDRSKVTSCSSHQTLVYTVNDVVRKFRPFGFADLDGLSHESSE
jgi:hypothetical protein